jgi:hypothetical protein
MVLTGKILGWEEAEKTPRIVETRTGGVARERER